MGRAVDIGSLRAVARAAGLSALGVAAVEPFESTRADLEERRAAGLAATMAFTYRNPARATDPARLLPGARSLVVGALAYRRNEPARPQPDRDHVAAARPVARVARYAWEDHYATLRSGLAAVAGALSRAGWRTAVVADSNGLVDREAAYRAGLGWYGKSSNLLLPGRGSWFVLGSVVTDADLPADRPLPDGCGACRRCLDGCPTGAIVAPGVVDARRCMAWLVQAPGPLPREYRVALGDRIYGCDDCQEVCPPNRHEARSRSAPPSGGLPTVDLLDLLAAGDAELLARHGHWYIAGRQARWLRRNAHVALGNVADPADAGARECVASHLRSDDPVLRAHAAWAARRLGHDDLLGGVVDDPDPDVRAELDGHVPTRRAAAAAPPGPRHRTGLRAVPG
jgi:epoxyqueuosine reductase